MNYRKPINCLAVLYLGLFAKTLTCSTAKQTGSDACDANLFTGFTVITNQRR